jgi:KDEL-tailed cysteine endopeptidase
MEEYNFRKSLFDSVGKEIKEFNEAPEQTSSVAHNFTSTMTQGEKKRMLGFRGQAEVKKAKVLEEANYDSINWVTAGKVNSV